MVPSRCSRLRTEKFSFMKSTRSWAHKITPSDFWTSSVKIDSWLLTWNIGLKFLSKRWRMSFMFSSSFGSSSRGRRPFRLSQMFISGRVVTRNRIHIGSLLKYLSITSNSSLLPWYSLSSKASITTREVKPGSLKLFSGSSNSNSNKSSVSISLISSPRFLESCSTRTSLYSGREYDKWQAKDWSITLGFLWRILLCWQKWLPNSLLSCCIRLETSAAITDFPMPAFPTMTITRWKELLSFNQFLTLTKIDIRVPSKYLSEWYLIMFSVSTLASCLRISSSRSVLSWAWRISVTTSCTSSNLALLSCNVSWVSRRVCFISFWAWYTPFNCVLISISQSVQSRNASR